MRVTIKDHPQSKREPLTLETTPGVPPYGDTIGTLAERAARRLGYSLKRNTDWHLARPDGSFFDLGDAAKDVLEDDGTYQLVGIGGRG